jgi:glucokinase
VNLAVGVDLGGTNARVALVDVERGALVGEEAKQPLVDRAPAAVADLITDLVRAVDPRGERVGVGVGIAAMLRGWTGVVVNAPNLGWREVDFRSLLRDRVGTRTELYNDLNAIAYGEATYGGARGVRDVLFCFVGTGVGAGLVLDGNLYSGATHLAGEFGHTKVVPHDAPGVRRCGCGQLGCLEAYASGRNIQARAQEELKALMAAGQPRPSLAIELAPGLEHVHAGHLDHAARLGDAYADRLWNEVARYLGMALANAVTLLNPTRLVMGGGVWQGAPELARRSLKWLHESANAPSLEGFSAPDSTLGDIAGVLGAAALISAGGP